MLNSAEGPDWVGAQRGLGARNGCVVPGGKRLPSCEVVADRRPEESGGKCRI